MNAEDRTYNYLIEFIYEPVRARQMKSTVYCSSLEDADENIEKHIKDESRPRAIKYRLYNLAKVGDIEREDSYED